MQQGLPRKLSAEDRTVPRSSRNRTAKQLQCASRLELSWMCKYYVIAFLVEIRILLVPIHLCNPSSQAARVPGWHQQIDTMLVRTFGEDAVRRSCNLIPYWNMTYTWLFVFCAYCHMLKYMVILINLCIMVPKSSDFQLRTTFSRSRIHPVTTRPQ